MIRRVLWSAASALFGILLLSAATIDDVPALVSLCLAALAIVTVARPAIGLMILGTLVPIATWIGRTWDGSLAWPEVVVVAFLFGYTARQAVLSPRGRADALMLAIYATIALAAASLSVEWLVLGGTIGKAALESLVRELASGGYFVGDGGFAGLDAAMRLIEGLLLAHAGVSLARAQPEVARRVVTVVVIGAAAASALNVWRVWLAALRLDSPVIGFLGYLLTLRLNVHYGDINAAGSYFLMALPPAVALARAASAWRWTLPALLIAVSLVLSGSRAAILAGIVTGGIIWLIKYAEERRAPVGIRSAAVIALIGAVACVGVSYVALYRNLTPTATALRVRAEYTRISAEMLATRPIFGIGIGQYPARLLEFATPTLMAIYPAPHENAHNNFLQVLAELGIAGFAAFICVLGIATTRMRPLWQSVGSTMVGRSACAGVLAFVLTWLSGHPLLVDAPAFSFWLLFGTLTGWGTAIGSSGLSESPLRNGASGRAGWERGTVAALLVVLVASIPVRAERGLGEANLEHVGIGVSQWQPEKDGVEYRLGGASSVVFIPSYASAVEIPLRAAATGSSLRVEVYLDGRAADVVTVHPEGWYRFVLQVPHHGEGTRFRSLELRVIDGSARPETDLLMIGKVRPRG